EDDAADGLADGRYQAVITIPEEFSAAATSSGQAISDGGGKPEQATIEVTTPDDGLVADDLITGQIATVAASTMGTMLSDATTENILVGFTTIGDQIGEAAAGAEELADGARSAADGAAELPDGATKLADGASALGSGATELASGLGTIATNTRGAATGASELGAGLTDGAATLERSGLVPDQLFTAANGAKDATTGVSSGVTDLKGGLEQLYALCDGRVGDPVCIGLEQTIESMPALENGAVQAAQAAAGTATGLTAFDTEATKNVAGQLRTAG